MHILFAGDLVFYKAKNYENHHYLNQNDTVYTCYTYIAQLRVKVRWYSSQFRKKKYMHLHISSGNEKFFKNFKLYRSLYGWYMFIHVAIALAHSALRMTSRALEIIIN